MTIDFTIMPAAFQPLGNGLGADLRAFDYVHKENFHARYGAAKWDIQNVQTDVIVDDDGETVPVTTFSIIVTNGSEMYVYDGIGIDSEVLPDSAKLVVADSQHQAIAEHQRAIESPNHDNEGE